MNLDPDSENSGDFLERQKKILSGDGDRKEDKKQEPEIQRSQTAPTDQINTSKTVSKDPLNWLTEKKLAIVIFIGCLLAAFFTGYGFHPIVPFFGTGIYFFCIWNEDQKHKFLSRFGVILFAVFCGYLALGAWGESKPDPSVLDGHTIYDTIIHIVFSWLAVGIGSLLLFHGLADD